MENNKYDPPSLRVQWKGDDESNQCDGCQKDFGFFRRRHHCRQCGGLFCSNCCNEKAKGVAGYGESLQRVCHVCRETALVEGGRSTGVNLPRPRDRKVCILGQAAVGKTALCHQFMEHSAHDEQRSTLPSAQSRSIRFKGSEYNIILVDTPGQTNADLFQPHYTIGANAFVLMYAVDDKSSFHALEGIREKILECGGHDVLMMLVGSKADLPRSMREVSVEEAGVQARKWHMRYGEITTRRQRDVDNLILSLLKEIVSRD